MARGKRGRSKATANYLGEGASVPNPKVTPGRSPLASAKGARPSVPATPATPQKFPGVSSPRKRVTNKRTTPARARPAPGGTPLQPNA
jgi:hypothetical protein